MAGTLDLHGDLIALNPAPYNPRKIGDEDLDALRESISVLGAVKPIIARGSTIVAGHQRTRAMRALGLTHAPIYRLGSEASLYDEIRFNQLENGTSKDAGDEGVVLHGGPFATGWHTFDRLHGHVANFRGALATVRDEIAALINKYGPWGAVVATTGGEVIHAAQYALATFLTNAPLTVCVISDDKVEFARKALGRRYGVFSYDGLERTTYVQTLAQMFRLRQTDSGKQNKSTLYEMMALPYVLKHEGGRYLDFGSGHGDYAAALRRRGLNVHDVELFRRAKASNAIDLRAVNGMVTNLAADLVAFGQYDAVICDSVLNSVDSLDAEEAVMTTLNALTRAGGKVFFSGRPIERNERAAQYTKRVDAKSRRAVEFLDEHGFTAIYRAGHWFYQRYHRRDEIAPLCEAFGLRLDRHVHGVNSWQVEATKIAELPREAVKSAFAFEFDIEVAEGKSLGRAADMLGAYDAARAKVCSSLSSGTASATA